MRTCFQFRATITLAAAASLTLGAAAFGNEAMTMPPAGSSGVWWHLPLALFGIAACTGILAVLTGAGGAVIFVPIVSTFFPFHIDFVRGAGLLVALTGALYASPTLLRSGLADLRLALPMALISSTAAILGALIGLRLPPSIVQTALGITILGIVLVMAYAQRAEHHAVEESDAISRALGIGSSYYEQSAEATVSWKIHRSGVGMALFVVIGFMAGLFGIGAGWANVPVLNLVLGAPLKIAVGTSKFILSITDTTAAWIYINSGAVIPMIAVPAIAGMILGTGIGVRLLTVVPPRHVRTLLILLLLSAAIMSLVKGILGLI